MINTENGYPAPQKTLAWDNVILTKVEADRVRDVINRLGPMVELQLSFEKDREQHEEEKAKLEAQVRDLQEKLAKVVCVVSDLGPICPA